jgi:GNAT superfamily N-acetyltransferase
MEYVRRLPVQRTLDLVTIRRAGPEDGCTIAALFQSVYRNSSHPFQSTACVAQFLLDERNFQIVAEEDHQVVASMAMVYNPWNDSYELGRALTLPEYRRNGLAGLLMQQVVGWAADAGFGELIFGYPRVRRIADLCADLDPKIVVAGHDAGRNVANGGRETHLIVCGVQRHARFTHVAPGIAALLDWRFLIEQLYAPLGLIGSPGEYPSECFVGAISQKQMSLGAWILDYAPANPSGALEVIGLQDDGATPCQIAQELNQILCTMPEVQHVTATILADKVEIIRALAWFGFEISAYLPAWYRSGSFRYDCVQLARRQYDDEAATQDFPDLLRTLQAEFRSSPILRLPEKAPVLANCA